MANLTDLDLAHLTPTERAEVDALIRGDRSLWRPLPGPQQAAYDSPATIVGFGGAAGGGKTDLAIGLALTRHQRVAIFRQHGTELLSIIDRIAAILRSRDGLSGVDRVWRTTRGDGVPVQIEFGGLAAPGDESKYQGRPHDLVIIDEAQNVRPGAVRFLLGWLRTTDQTQRCRALLTFNPPTTVEGRWIVQFFAPWLDKSHPNPAKPGELRWFAVLDGKDVEVAGPQPFEHNGERVAPTSRTFVGARVSDNPFLASTGYATMLQALPEPLRSQMLNGDFTAGMEDDPWQVVPTAWAEAAMARWKRPDRLPPMDSMGVDVARGGRDSTVVARRHGMWFDMPLCHPGSTTPDGPSVAGLVVAALRDCAPIHIDVIGVGSSPYDFLNNLGLQVVGVNVAESARDWDKSRRLQFRNLRSELWWRMREALDPVSNTGIALPPDRRLLADLCAPTWKLTGSTIAVASREEIAERIGRSPDFGSAFVLALIDTPRESAVLDRFGLEVHRGVLFDPKAHLFGDQAHVDGQPAEETSPYKRITRYSTVGDYNPYEQRDDYDPYPRRRR